MDKINTLKLGAITAGGVLGATVAFLYGGWSDGLTTLLFFQCVDFVLGLSAAHLHGVGDSRRMVKGFYKKIGTWVALAVAYRIDVTLPIEGVMVMTAGLGAFNLAELYSVVENLGKLGVATDFLSKYMKQVEESRKDNTDDNSK